MPTIPTDTSFSLQWHLKNDTSGEFDLNVVDAWDDYTGKGVKLIVIDDGFDHTNTDLSPNYQFDEDRDFGAGDDDAAPFYTSGFDDCHGTAVAGIAAAAANGTGVVGVAFGADLIGYRLDFYSSDFVTHMAQALNSAAKHGDTVNMSLGIGYYFDTSLNPIVKAINKAVDTGRDGLGTILVQSGGNNRDNVEWEVQLNGRPYDGNTQMINVAGVDRNGYVSYYSSYGAPLLISAFGTPGEVVTTDRVGANGYNTSPGDTGIYDSFNGTSAAAPQITGVTALMLDANPNLGWRDVQTILAYSARHVGSDMGAGPSFDELFTWEFNGANNWNGGGLHYSQDYGYGLVDARAAVRLAETWQRTSTSENEKIVSKSFGINDTTLADDDSLGTTFNTKVKDNIDVERIGLDIGFTGRPVDLVIYLTNPEGQEIELVSKAGLSGPDTYRYEFQSQQYRGESSAGNWSVRIADVYDTNITVITDLRLKFYGSAASKNDTYIYTDEFSEFPATHDGNLADVNGGRDLLNASAVTSAMTVNLGTQTGTIDGVAMTIAGIDDVFGGDGDDTLSGSKGNNILAGSRGEDLLSGLKGDDDFRYWHIRDSRTTDRDLITDFGLGDDDIDLKRIDANKATDKNDAFKFIGDDAFTNVAGQLRFVKDAGVTRVEGDVDGDGSADFAIDLTGLIDLVKGDFIL
jgi:subtilisin-like proprotein convertase family protein